MNYDENNSKRFINHRLKWLGIYMTIGLVIAILLPFPVDLMTVFGVLFLINLFRRRVVMKRYGRSGGIKDLFGSHSPSISGNSEYRPLRYYCMSCGKEHKQVSCPSCGSRMKRVG
ncbi:MAG: hypothetical protein ACR2IS_14925 [Nitrososphaeraceae archaeon]